MILLNYFVHRFFTLGKIRLNFSIGLLFIFGSVFARGAHTGTNTLLGFVIGLGAGELDDWATRLDAGTTHDRGVDARSSHAY